MNEKEYRDSLIKLGKHIVYLRVKFRMNQAELAKRAKISIRDLIKIEGGFGNVSMGNLIAIAERFQIYPSELFNINLNSSDTSRYLMQEVCPKKDNIICYFLPGRNGITVA